MWAWVVRAIYYVIVEVIWAAVRKALPRILYRFGVVLGVKVWQAVVFLAALIATVGFIHWLLNIVLERLWVSLAVYLSWSEFASWWAFLCDMTGLHLWISAFLGWFRVLIYIRLTWRIYRRLVEWRKPAVGI